MTLDEWKAFAIFGLGVYALSFFSMNAALFLLITVGIAAFVTRYTQATVSSAATKAAQAAATALKKG
jgi:ABC-type transport system involved in cytochrome bd biosynthesis fused ATPase/permease subunit